MTARVHVVGNAVFDLVVHGRGGGTGAAADGWGDNVEILDRPALPSLGGCGAAPAYVLARLGQAVSLASNLGDDDFGRLLAGWLGDAGVELAPPIPGRATAVHVIHVDGARRRSSYWRGHKVRWDAPAPGGVPEWFLATGYGAVDADDLQQLTAVCASMRGAGARVLFDPSPWFAGRVAPAAMLDLWRVIDVLTGTETELSHWLPNAGHGEDLARACHGVGPGFVAVKRGSQGACWATAGAAGTEPAVPVPAANSVGAGDTFNAGLADALIRGASPGHAVAAAVTLATRVVAAGRGALGAF